MEPTRGAQTSRPSAEPADAARPDGGAEHDAESFEDILRLTCGSGRWQTALLAYMSLMWLILPFFSMSMMFIGATPPFKCADGFDANATYASLPAAAQRCHPPNASAACRRWVFDRSVYESTVVTEWALVCGRKPLLSLLQSLLMLGGLSGAVAAGQLA
ncbi:organic cation transporter-like protein, partial [Pollicipes pollicipes]